MQWHMYIPIEQHCSDALIGPLESNHLHGQTQHSRLNTHRTLGHEFRKVAHAIKYWLLVYFRAICYKKTSYFITKKTFTYLNIRTYLWYSQSPPRQHNYSHNSAHLAHLKRYSNRSSHCRNVAGCAEYHVRTVHPVPMNQVRVHGFAMACLLWRIQY